MRASAVAGLVFANINDDLLKKLTAKRSMASVPFGARYRLIDFPLSNLVNAGISSVGIITKENYRSLIGPRRQRRLLGFRPQKRRALPFAALPYKRR